MQKQFIPKYLAERLESLGFDEICLACYSRDGSIIFNRLIDKLEASHYFGGCSAPLWQQALYWLRYAHNIYIIPFPELDKWILEIKFLKGIKGNPVHTGYPDLEYNTYEEALEFGVNKALDIIENGKIV